jgi:hypothetical protein
LKTCSFVIASLLAKLLKPAAAPAVHCHCDISVVQ